MSLDYYFCNSKID